MDAQNGAEPRATGDRRPVLLAVDSEQAMAEVESDLRHRYAADYRIACFTDHGAALAAIDEIAEAGGEIALVLAAGSPASPSELFDRARRRSPQAKRALLVPPGAWTNEAVAEQIRNAMALGRIDHYVQRPTRAPDEVFHEAVSSFLLEWARERRRVPQTVHIVGEEWAGRAFDLRETFARCAVPHTFNLADSDEGRAILEKLPADVKLPLMALPDGRILGDPTDAEIAAAAGAPSQIESHRYDLVVVGAGPAGLSAAVNAASEGLAVLVIDEGGIGGQARSSSLIRNYLGFAKGISGSRLAEQAHEQALVFGAQFLFVHRVAGLDRADGRLVAQISDGRHVEAGAVVLAMGAVYRRLGIDALEELHGAGVFYGGPVSEAPALVGQTVYVVGGGNSAGQAALHLARYAEHVTLAVRAAGLEQSMSRYLIRELDATPNVTVSTSTRIVGGGGDGRLEELVLRSGEAEWTTPADALFVLIGARPQSEWLPEQVVRDAHGFVLTGGALPGDCAWPLERPPLSLETGMPGVLAAGDVRHGSVKRVAAAVGEGATAVQLVHGLLGEHRALGAGRR